MNNIQYTVIQLTHTFGCYNLSSIDDFNQKLNNLHSDGWNIFQQPSLNIDHTAFTVVLFKEIPKDTPYR